MKCKRHHGQPSHEHLREANPVSLWTLGAEWRLSRKNLRLLDLFCGAGGAAMGLHRALDKVGIDHEIVGVDINPQAHYPFRFIQADAMTFPLGGYDFIWASPPCQLYTQSALSQRNAGKIYPDLLPPTRERLNFCGRSMGDRECTWGADASRHDFVWVNVWTAYDSASVD